MSGPFPTPTHAAQYWYERAKEAEAALEGLDAPLAWLCENNPAAMEAMPEEMARAIGAAGRTLAAVDASTANPSDTSQRTERVSASPGSGVVSGTTDETTRA